MEPHDRPAIWVDWDPKPATLESLSAAAEQLRTNGPGNVARSYASIRVDGVKYSAKHTPTPNSPIKAAPYDNSGITCEFQPVKGDFNTFYGRIKEIWKFRLPEGPWKSEKVLFEVDWYAHVEEHPRLKLCKRVQPMPSEEGSAPEDFTRAEHYIDEEEPWLDPVLVQSQTFTTIDPRPLGLPFRTGPGPGPDVPLTEEPVGLYHLLFTRNTGKQRLPPKPEGAGDDWHRQCINRMYVSDREYVQYGRP